MRTSRLVTAAILVFAATGACAALYKWVDEHGRVQYSDRPPTGKDKAGVQMSNRGIVVKKLEPGLTPEQKKAREDEDTRKRQDDQKATDQRRQDNALLQSFTSVEEIDMKRDREIQTLEALISNLRSQERAANLRMLEDRKRLQAYTQSGKPAPDTVKEDLARSESEKKTLTTEVERRQQEITATRSKYDFFKRRFVELRQEGYTGAIQPAAASAPTPSAKK